MFYFFLHTPKHSLKTLDQHITLCVLYVYSITAEPVVVSIYWLHLASCVMYLTMLFLHERQVWIGAARLHDMKLANVLHSYFLQVIVFFAENIMNVQNKDNKYNIRKCRTLNLILCK